MLNEANINTMLTLINLARTQGSNCQGIMMYQVPMLVNNIKLNQAALKHCLDMRDNMNGLNHLSSDGSDLGQRITAENYLWSFVGENIAFGQPDEQTAFNAWMGSNQGHCEAIMSSNYTETGIARIGDYWTVVFARPM